MSDSASRRRMWPIQTPRLSACAGLQLADNAAREREAVAVRIIELARRGERDPIRLSEHVIRSADLAQ